MGIKTITVKDGTSYTGIIVKEPDIDYIRVISEEGDIIAFLKIEDGMDF